ASTLESGIRQDRRGNGPYTLPGDRGKCHRRGRVQINRGRDQPRIPRGLEQIFLMILYALTILVSAFLLFQVQPVIAKIILPWFGGSAAVWTTCLLFFQMVLLLGYLYSHAVVRYLRPRIQMVLHV